MSPVPTTMAMIIKKLMVANNRGGVVTFKFRFPVDCRFRLHQDDSAVIFERFACSDCHDTHGTAKFEHQMKTDSKTSESCTSCHVTRPCRPALVLARASPLRMARTTGPTTSARTFMTCRAGQRGRERCRTRCRHANPVHQCVRSGLP